MATLTVNDITVPITDEGTGPPILFLHGNPESRHGWDHIITQLDGYRSLAPDLPGFGESSPPPAGYDFTIAAQTRFLDSLVATLKLDDRLTIVAHDIGALMAIPYAAANPDRVRGLLIMNTVFDPEFRWFPAAKIWGNAIGGHVFMFLMNRFAFKRALKTETTDEVVANHGDRIYDNLTRTTKASIRALYAKMIRPGFFEPHLSDLETVAAQNTTRVLWGANDGFISPEQAHRFSPQPTLVDQAGHWIALERPDLVIDEIHRFH